MDTRGEYGLGGSGLKGPRVLDPIWTGPRHSPLRNGVVINFISFHFQAVVYPPFRDVERDRRHAPQNRHLLPAKKQLGRGGGVGRSAWNVMAFRLPLRRGCC